MPRIALKEFSLANPLYRGARVSFYTVVNGVKTAQLATLYRSPTGVEQLANPQSLDSRGAAKQPIYYESAIVATIEGIHVPTHDTGIIAPAPTFRVNSSTGAVEYSFDAGATWNATGDYFFRDRGTWAAATSYERNDQALFGSDRYVALDDHVSTASFAADLAAGHWRIVWREPFANVKNYGAVGDGVTNDSAAFVAALATGKKVFAPAGTYAINVRTLPSNAYLFGEGELTVIKPFDTTQRGALGCDSGDGSQITGLTLRDFKLLGPVVSLAFSEQRHLLDLQGVRRCLIERVYFEGAQGDCMYLGTGLTVYTHNNDVTVRDCTFDGLINDNRQGISVIDVDGMLIEGCVFRNLARSDMPGSVDFEPDLATDVIKNVRVVGNRFLNTDGNRGHLCIQTQDTTNVENIAIIGNHFEDVPVNSAGVIFNTSRTVPATPQRFLIEGNTFDVSGSRGIYKRDGALDGLVIKGNIISALTGIWLTFAGPETTSDNVVVQGNIIYDEAGSSGMLVNESVSNLSIKGNLFKGTPTRHLHLVGTTHIRTSITDNDFIGAASSGAIITGITTPNAITNILLGNRFENNALVQFAAAISDYPGSVANPVGADETSTPSAFNPGISRVRLTNRTIAGVSQSGILETYAMTGTGYAAHFQLFYPDQSAAFKDKIYFRKGTGAGTWDVWYLLGGELTGSATFDPGNLVDGAGTTTTVTVTGAALGDFADASFSLDLQGITLSAWVSAADTVSVRFQNESGGPLDLASGTLRARVRKA